MQQYNTQHSATWNKLHITPNAYKTKMWYHYYHSFKLYRISLWRYSSFLHNRRNKALHKALTAMDSKSINQCNKLIQLENCMLTYGIYNAETLEQLRNSNHIHNTTSSHEKLFVGQQSIIKTCHYMQMYKAYNITQ